MGEVGCQPVSKKLAFQFLPADVYWMDSRLRSRDGLWAYQVTRSCIVGWLASFELPRYISVHVPL